MKNSTVSSRDQLVDSNRDVLAHWAWTIPILLFVGALAARQIDLYPPSPDEFYTMYDVGWLAVEARSPVQVVNTIRENNPSQSPGYFLLLSLWGNLAGYSLPIGRVLGVLGGLLSLSIAYRLAKDLVAPVAGLFAAIILASNVFYNMYVPFVRMYAILVFVAGLCLWLYFRVLQKRGRSTRRDILALTIALTVLPYIHGFGTLMIVTLAIYHVLFVAKDRAWYWPTLSMIIAVLLFSPWLSVLIGAMSPEPGSLSIVDRLSSPVVAGSTVIRALLSSMTNGQYLLLALTATGFAFGVWKQRLKFLPLAMPLVIFTVLLYLVAEFATWARIGTLRHHLYGWQMAVLVFAAGHYALYKLHSWLGLTVIFWIIAGIAFQREDDLIQLVMDRYFGVSRSPWHQVSRMGANSEQPFDLIAYNYKARQLNWRGYVDYSQKEHYFDNIGISFSAVADAREFDSHVRSIAAEMSKVWIALRPSRVDANERNNIRTVMTDFGYELCESMELSNDTSLLKFAWTVSKCEDLAPVYTSSNRLIYFQFYGSSLEEGGSRFQLAYDWTARDTFDYGNYKMSFQLLSPNWDLVAQTDLPLAREGIPLQLSINASDVDAGSYQLVATLYNAESMETVDWFENPGPVAFMLPLDKKVVSASD